MQSAGCTRPGTCTPCHSGSISVLFVVVLVSESVLATWIYNSTRGSVLATMVYHQHSTHVASLVPVIPGIMGIEVMAIVSVAAAIGAIAASGGPLIGVSRSQPVGAAAEPGLP